MYIIRHISTGAYYLNPGKGLTRNLAEASLYSQEDLALVNLHIAKGYVELIDVPEEDAVPFRRNRESGNLHEDPIFALLNVAKSALEWIDAVPSKVVADLPTMPGFSRDWADEVINNAEQALSNKEMN